MTEHDEKRQTNEVAIARLEVNVEYIKQAVDEIKRQSCDSCATAIALRSHIEDHKTHANMKWDKTKYYITTAIAIAALAITILAKSTNVPVAAYSSASIPRTQDTAEPK